MSLPKPYYQDDWCQIFCADCREILPELPKVDLVITDPPYNVGLDYCDGDKRQDYRSWCQSWFSKVRKPLVFTPGCVNLSMWFTIAEPTWVCAWVKTNQCSFSYLGGPNMWEPVLVYGTFERRITRDVWIVPIAGQDECSGHPCPKSLRFWRQLLCTFALAEENSVVVDPFLGSGTTCLVAKERKIKSIGIEIEEKYCAIAVERLRQEVFAL